MRQGVAFLHFLHFPHDLLRFQDRHLANPDATRLICLLQGWWVVALTKDTTVIETATGTVSCRRCNKPAQDPATDPDPVSTALGQIQND